MNLTELHSDHRALQEHLADARARYNAKREELNAALAALETEWRNANAELIEELNVIGQQADAKEKELRAAVLAAYQANPASKTPHAATPAAPSRASVSKKKLCACERFGSCHAAGVI